MTRPILKYKTYKQLRKELVDSTRKTIALYLDMDGVFCGFEQRIKEIFPDFDKLDKKYHDELKTDEEKHTFKQMISSIISKKDFWSTLPWEPGGKELYRFIKSHKHSFKSISFLTSPIKSDKTCISQKQEWVMKQFKSVPLDAFYADSNKWEYVNRQPADIQLLIDDRPKNIEKWEESGGTGILHNSTNLSHTLDTLRNLL